MIMRMFPPFPIPGFTPNFTGFQFDGIDWYDTQAFLAQAPKAAVFFVSLRGYRTVCSAAAVRP